MHSLRSSQAIDDAMSSGRSSRASSADSDNDTPRKRAGSNDWMQRIGRGGIVEKIRSGLADVKQQQAKRTPNRSRANSKEGGILDIKSMEVDLETEL